MSEYERQKRVTKFFKIMLFIVGIGMLLFIGNTMYAVYQSSTISTSNTTVEAERNIDCYQLSFKVGYAAENTIKVTNSFISSFEIEELTFVDLESGETVVKELDFFRPDSEREINIESMGFDTFYVFPFDCQNIKEICNMTAESCFDPTSYFDN